MSDPSWVSREPDLCCPVCGGHITSEPSCPGYGRPKDQGGTGVMVCYPPHWCGNATEFTCVGVGTAGPCGWWYRDPNRRGGDMGVRPAWLDDGTFKTLDQQLAEAE